jgi:hypothetical protein
MNIGLLALLYRLQLYFPMSHWVSHAWVMIVTIIQVSDWNVYTAKTPSGKITKVPLRDLIKEIWAMRSASAAPISKL